MFLILKSPSPAEEFHKDVLEHVLRLSGRPKIQRRQPVEHLSTGGIDLLKGLFHPIASLH